MERGPEIKFVGRISKEMDDEQREKIKNDLIEAEKKRLYEAHYGYASIEEMERLHKMEFQKTPEESLIIGYANGATNRILERLGFKTWDVPERNVHIIEEELYEKEFERKTPACFVRGAWAIAINDKPGRYNKLMFAHNVFHEMMHMKGITVYEAWQNEDGTMGKNLLRAGSTVNSTNKKDSEDNPHAHFKGLEEAIVVEEERRFTEELLELDIFQEEKEWLESEEAMKKRKEIAEKRNISPEDMEWISKEDDGLNIQFAYVKQSQVYRYVMNVIAQENGLSNEQVHDIFLKSHFDGKILEVARLVEKSFGEGSFRELGSMSDKESTAILVLEALKKFRLRMLKNRNS